MKNAQLEMGFTSHTSFAARRARRQQRTAHWWFERMREVVERACDWELPPVPRPEQIWLAGIQRKVNLVPGVGRAPAGKRIELCS